MIKKMIQKRTIGEKKMCGRRGYLHPLLQAVTHSTREAMRPEKKRYEKKNRKKQPKRRRRNSFFESQPMRSDMSTERFRIVNEEKQIKW